MPRTYTARMRTLPAIVLVSMAIASSSARADSKVQSKTGYLKTNGRCDGYGIMFIEKSSWNPGEDYTCVVFPTLDGLSIPDDAKKAAYRELLDKRVAVTFQADTANAHMKLLSVQVVK